MGVGAPAEAIQKLGGARVILATAPDAKDSEDTLQFSALTGILRPDDQRASAVAGGADRARR